MEPRSLDYICAACQGELARGRPETRVLRVCTDSRLVQPGDLFVALGGERFDGHAFLAAAVEKGTAAVIVARSKAELAARLPPSLAVIVVEDTRAALGSLGARYRSDFDLPVIAVGGSNGKTTTKELLAAVLRQKLNTLWSEASFNNEIGVPLTLLKLERVHQAAVVEVGSNHPGELEPLLRAVRPRFGVLTNVGREHLEFFGDLAGVAREEGWLAEVLPPDGKLFANGDNDWTDPIARRSKAPVVRVGLGDRNDWRAERLAPDQAGTTFQLKTPRHDFSGDYRVNLVGRHQVTNSLFALAVGAELGLSAEETRRGLASCQAPKMRMQMREAGGVRVLDDTYNANVDSVLAALQTLGELPCAGRRVAVLGDMAELGAHSDAAHAEAGRAAAGLGIDTLVTVGERAQRTAAAARAAGLHRVLELGTVAEAAAALPELVRAGDVVLLKASRSTGLERATEALVQRLMECKK